MCVLKSKTGSKFIRMTCPTLFALACALFLNGALLYELRADIIPTSKIATATNLAFSVPGTQFTSGTTAKITIA